MHQVTPDYSLTFKLPGLRFLAATFALCNCRCLLVCSGKVLATEQQLESGMSVSSGREDRIVYSLLDMESRADMKCEGFLRLSGRRHGRAAVDVLTSAAD